MVLTMAWRNLWRNKMRSLVIILSVALGLFAGIMVLAVYKGMMRDRIKIVIEQEVGHIQLHHPEFKKDYDPRFIVDKGPEIIGDLQQNKNIQYFSTRSLVQGMLSVTTGSAGVQIHGIDFDEECKVSHLDKKMKEGHTFIAGKQNEIIIGKKLAGKMKLKTGNKLILTFTDAESNLLSAAFRISGIYESDNAPLEEKNVYVHRETLNDMLGIGNGYHELVMILQKDTLLDSMQSALQSQYKNTSVQTWKTISPETDLMVVTVDAMSNIIIGIILFALAFGIVNTMLMAILERTREIGMMMALGMNKFRLFSLVLLETVFLTFVGTPIGLLIGWLLCSYLEAHGINWATMGKDLMSSFGFSTMIYPVFPSEKIVSTILFVLITALLSCIYPAVKALYLKPVDALRK